MLPLLVQLSPTAFIASLLLLANDTHAIQVPICKAPLPLRRERTLLTNESGLGDHQNYGLRNGYNGVYNANITVGGQVFSVQIDTGSSDLWVDTCAARVTLQGTSPSSFHGTITVYYDDQSYAEGPVVVSEVAFGDFAVPQQAFIQTCNSTALLINMTGLLGLGSSTAIASQIIDALPEGDTTRYTLLDHIFSAYPAEQQYTSTLLSRTSYEEADGGILTIGEVAAGYEEILATPQLSVLSDWSWVIAVDNLMVNGEGMYSNMSSTTGVDGLQPGQLLMLLDTGTSDASLPAPLVHAIYQDLPGALFQSDIQTWTLPCSTGKVNVSLLIGDQLFPIHPLDVVVPPYPDTFYPGQLESGNSGVVQCSVLPRKGMLRSSRDGSAPTMGNGTDTPMCQAAFTCASPDLAGSSGVDGILGDTFLRNAYAQFNYGNWSQTGTGAPFVRLLNVRRFPILRSLAYSVVPNMNTN